MRIYLSLFSIFMDEQPHKARRIGAGRGTFPPLRGSSSACTSSIGNIARDAPEEWLLCAKTAGREPRSGVRNFHRLKQVGLAIRL